MCLELAIHGMGHVMRTDVLVLLHHDVCCCVFSLYDECSPHTPPVVFVRRSAPLEVRSALYETYNDDALALSMLVLVTACDVTCAHVAGLLAHV